MEKGWGWGEVVSRIGSRWCVPSKGLTRTSALSPTFRLLTTVLIFTYFVPIAFVQSLVSAPNLIKTFPFLEPFFTNYPELSAMLVAFIPTVILAIFFALLTPICRGMPPFEAFLWRA